MPSDGKSSHCLWQGELKKFKCVSPVFLNNCLKHEKCFNMVSAKAHSSTKHVLSHSGG
jgi:hypothetical protein